MKDYDLANLSSHSPLLHCAKGYGAYGLPPRIIVLGLIWTKVNTLSISGYLIDA